MKTAIPTLLFAALLAGAQTTSGEFAIPFDFTKPPPFGFFSRTWKYGGTGEVEKVYYTVHSPFRRPLAVRVTDASGQTFQMPVPQGSEAWFSHEKEVEGRWDLHFGGANDGVIHHPIRDFQILVLGGKMDRPVGEVRVKDIVFRERSSPSKPEVKLYADVYTDDPPLTLDVELKATSGDFAGGTFAAQWSDWDGNRVAGQSVECPPVASGGIWKVSLPYAAPPAGKKAVFCNAELRYGGSLIVQEGPAWTAPVELAAPSKAMPSSPWGTGIYLHRWGGSQRSFAKMKQLAEAANRAGIKWLREEMVWRHVVKKGPADFAYYDRIMEICETNGMSVCMLFGAMPRDIQKTDPDFPEKYCDALRKAVRHYKGRVAAWEICNEPNLPWPMDPRWAENYKRLLPMATKIVHEEDPAARSVGCSASGLGVGFVRSLADQTFDDVSVHPYRRFVDEREFLADLAELHAAGKGRDIWMTEIGWDSFPGYRRVRSPDHLIPLHEQASLIARAYMTTAAFDGLKAVFGYDFVDDGIVAAGFEYHMGVVYENVSPKPAYRALAKVCRTFESGKPLMEVRDNGLRIFRMGGKCAVWVHGFEPTEIVVEKDIPATNLMDEKVLPKKTDGKIVYRVDSHHPIFFDADPGGLSLGCK